MCKFIVEVLVAIFLHPLAFVLALINISGRDDLTSLQKVGWAIVCLFWGIGPILYMTLANGELW